MSDLSKLWVTASATPQQVARIQKGTKGRLLLGSGAAAGVEVLLVDPAVEAATRRARVRFGLNDAAGIRPGDIGTVEVSLAAAEQVLIPRDAVIDLGDVQYVFVERGVGIFEPRVVAVGPLFNEERVVLDGLREGELVVARGAFVLDSESRLQAALAPVTGDGGAGR